MPLPPSPEDIFHYAYAIFHSPQYRARYTEFLRIDFPACAAYVQRAALPPAGRAGRRARRLAPAATPSIWKWVGGLRTTFPISGDNRVEKGHPKYDEAHQRVHINNAQYFEGVPPELWEHMVGGYQVLYKWLKDRKGRTLTSDDITHYQRIVRSLRETRRLMAEIDAAIGSFPLP